MSGTHLPIRVVVLMENTLVRSREDNQTSVVRSNSFDGRPGANDSIGWAEGEVMQVLVQRVTGSQGARIGGFVDEHRVHGTNIRTGETFNVIQDLK